MSAATGLRPAVEAVEARRADVVIVSRFDRLVRSVKVHGDLFAIDSGFITNGNATEKMTTHFLGAVSEYHRNTTRERTREARVRAIANGIPLTPGALPGYVRPITGTRPNGTDIHGPLEVDPALAPVIVDAFRMRAAGATVKDVRSFLRGRGVTMTTGGVQRLLSSRTYLGELHAGELVNLNAHDPIVPVSLWRDVQNVKVPRGRKSPSGRLLARLNVLCCESCGSRMTVGSSHGARYGTYRCPDTGDCAHRAAISADRIERYVSDRVREHLADVEGRASAHQNARHAALELERAQDTYDRAVRQSLGMDDDAVRDRLLELHADIDRARERVEQLGGADAALIVSAAQDWERLSLDARREIIRATVSRVTVAPGRGLGRVAVQFIGE